MEALRLRLSRAMIDVTNRLAAIGIAPWIEPQAGMFLWCRLPEGIDAADVARRSLAANILLAPGNVFRLSRTANSFLRFNTAHSDAERIFKFLAIDMRSCLSI